jgi:uncharacterized cupredoxin-like copper-binding protein
MKRFRIGFFALVALTAVAVWALPATAQQSNTKVTTITVTAGKPTEFSFKLSKKTAPHGIVTFKVTNSGALPHDFKIGGKTTKSLTPGNSATLRVVFGKAGAYPYLCTVTGHAAAGMKGVFKVT